MSLKKVILLQSFQIILTGVILNNYIISQHLAHQRGHETRLNLILGFLAFISSVSGIFVIKNLSKQMEDNYQQKMMLEKLKNIHEQEMLTRQFRHDLSNHIQVMSSLLEKSNYEKLKDYFNKIIGYMDT